MEELVIAALVGLSLGHSWLCLFMAFGMSTVELRTGVWFLAGRTIGLVALGLLIISAGLFLDLSPRLMQGAAGALAVGFGAFLVARHWRGTKEAGSGRQVKGECEVHDSEFKVHGSECCEHGKGHGHGHGPGDGSGKHCKNSEYKLKEHGSNGKNQRAFGFGLGVFRGITPCFKIIVLAPLLVAVAVPSALAMVLVFTAVSTVYPLIGYMSANTLHNIVRNRHLMIIIGAIILIAIGAYYMYEAVATAGVHVPGTGPGGA
jgi:ABC-type nickel/cobalt efflux system permease component RcnA